MLLTVSLSVSPLATLRTRSPPSLAYDARVACAASNWALISSYEGAAAAACWTMEGPAWLEVADLADSSSFLTTELVRRLSGVKVSSGEGDRLL
jgi:hypothetical protein